MKSKLLGLATLIALGAFATTAGALPFTLTGTTAGGPTWNRPLQGTPPTGLSGVGTAVRYNVFAFTVDTSGSYVFQNTATNPAGWDNYTFLYQNSFNPTSQFTNVLIGNDDNTTIGLSGFTFALTAGVTYDFITTGFSNTDFGAFSLVINGTGNVQPAGAAVPDGGTSILLLGLGLAGLCVANRAPGGRKAAVAA